MPHLFTESPHGFSQWYESPGETERFPRAVPAQRSRLLTRCLSHLRLWEREVPNAGSSPDHGNTPLLQSSRSKGSKPPSPDKRFSHLHVPTEQRPGKGSAWVSSHGVAAFPCQPERSAGSAGRAGIPQQYSDTFLPPSLPPAPSEQLGGEVTTPDLPPLSLARTPQILARLMGQAKLWL